MKRRKGWALLPVIMTSAMLMVLAVFLSKIVYNSFASVAYSTQREQAFWLAEAGLEAGKVKLHGNPNWYTDLAHLPEDDAEWVKAVAVGETEFLGEGAYKLVREKEKNRLYAAGRRGKAAVVLKVEFTVPPFKISGWSEI